jgi:beta-fructofuranosidase
MSVSRRKFLSTLAAAPIVSSPLRAAFARSSPSSDEALRARLAADPLRPQCHLLPAKNWMNDPNGPIFWKGQYHMFFQYNPDSPLWGDMHWAHAVGSDMIHWKHLPVALAPTPGWVDADGCFTGSAVDDRGTATAIYTGVKTSDPQTATLRDGAHNFREVQCLATSRDPQLLDWTKWKTPVLEPPNDPLLTGFRDPFMWRDGDVWYLGVGSGLRREGGRVLLYRSRDLRQWEYLHPLASGRWTERENVNPVDSGEMWECPDFFALASRHVLLYSTAGNVTWEVGELDPRELVFHPQRTGVLDHGAYYAQKTQLDAGGNRILWGWIPERRPDGELSAAGWAGCMALPRVLALDSRNDLEMRVAPALESLRQKEFLSVTRSTPRETQRTILGSIAIENLAGEIEWRVAAGPFSMTVRDRSGPWWRLEAECSDSSATLRINQQQIKFSLPDSRELEFHLILDASVAELFANHLHALTTRVYRRPDGPLHLEFAGGDTAALLALRAWQLQPISTDRLTT